MCKLLVVCQDALDPVLVDLWKSDVRYHHSLLRRQATVADNGVVNTWPIWTTMATGVPRSEHGIETFCKVNEDGTKRMWNRDDIKCNDKIMYEELNNMGLSVGWVALPVTSTPAVDINGFMIGENIGPVIDTKPEHLSDSILVDEDDWLDMYSHRVFSEGDAPTGSEWGGLSQKYLIAATKYMDNITDSVVSIYKDNPVDVLFVYYNKLDRLGHQCMDISWIMKACYRGVDNNLKTLVESINPENTIVMSDHGMKPVQRDIVEVNYPHSSMYEGRNRTYLAGDHRLPGFIGSTSDVLQPKKYRMTQVKDLIMKHL